MKFAKFLFCALAAMSVTGCKDDGPTIDTGAPTEAYNRAFVKEFGVPTRDMSYSMARTAGLKIKASRQTLLTITAPYEGDEYLVGELSVAPGYTSLPVTIPSDVSMLNLHICGETYSVPADGTVDLDKLPAPASRTITLGYVNGERVLLSTDDENRPVIAFPFSQFLKSHFEKHPVGVNQVDKNNSVYHKSELKLSGSVWDGVTRFGALKNQENTYYIFPIYWRVNSKGKKDYQFYLTKQRLSFDKSQAIPLDFGGTSTNPFPQLGYSTEITSLEQIDFSDLSNFTYADDNASQAFPIESDEDFYIISKGHQVDTRYSDEGVALVMESESLGNISSTDPVHNRSDWGDKYFNCMYIYSSLGLQSTKRYVKFTKDFNIYFQGADEDTPSWHFFGNRAPEGHMMVGFGEPPTETNDPAGRDFSNVLYLIVPASQWLTLFWDTKPDYPNFMWTVAAEDLGGSFDWDFNDAVFRFQDVIVSTSSFYYTPGDAATTRIITVQPLAAGGTMPLYITYTGKIHSIPFIDIYNWSSQQIQEYKKQLDWYTFNKAKLDILNENVHDGTYILGTEIHKWLGADTHTKQVNTERAREYPMAKAVSFAIPIDQNVASAGGAFTSSSNKPLFGFAVLVDKENKLNIDTRDDKGYSPMPNLTLGKGSYLIGAPDESKGALAPQMIVIPSANRNGGKSLPWAWPKEYINIKNSYTDFPVWLNGDKNSFSNSVRENIINNNDYEDATQFVWSYM